MNNSSEKSGARSGTRTKIIETFNDLLLAGSHPRPKVAQIIAEARVSRSTFYDHFDGVEALLSESLSHLFGALARSMITERDPRHLASLIEHIGENRAMAREFLSGERGDRAQALFARVIELELQGRPDARLDAILVSGTTLTALKNWVSGKVGSTPGTLADRLIAAAQAIIDNYES